MPPKQTSDEPGTWTRHTGAEMSAVQTRASLVAAVLLFLAGVYTLHEFLPALVWALVFAIGVWPLFDRASKRWPKHKKGLLPALVVLAILLVFVVPVTLIALSLARDAHGMADWVEQIRSSGLAAPPLLSKLPYGAQMVAWWQANLGQPGQISELTSRTLRGGLLTTGRKFGSEALHRLVLLGFTLLAVFLLLREAEGVIEQIKFASRRAFGSAGENVGRQLVLSVHGTVKRPGVGRLGRRRNPGRGLLYRRCSARNTVWAADGAAGHGALWSRSRLCHCGDRAARGEQGCWRHCRGGARLHRHLRC